MTAPSKPPLIQWWPILVSVGGVLVHGAYIRADADELNRRLSKAETTIVEHDKSLADSRERLRLLEADSVRNAQMTAIIIEKLAKIETNIAVLCQSVKGAQCVR